MAAWFGLENSLHLYQTGILMLIDITGMCMAM